MSSPIDPVKLATEIDAAAAALAKRQRTHDAECEKLFGVLPEDFDAAHLARVRAHADAKLELLREQLRLERRRLNELVPAMSRDDSLAKSATSDVVAVRAKVLADLKKIGFTDACDPAAYLGNVWFGIIDGNAAIKAAQEKADRCRAEHAVACNTADNMRQAATKAIAELEHEMRQAVHRTAGGPAPKTDQQVREETFDANLRRVERELVQARAESAPQRPMFLGNRK